MTSVCSLFSWIIPARAGFTHASTIGSVAIWDHPRSRGVYARLRVEKCIRERIIPARAGFTSSCPTTWASKSDHPRSRGVYATASSRSILYCGSSPLARGLPTPRPSDPWRSGIIPARAGFTVMNRERFGYLGDHPRSRGVYVDGDTSKVDYTGSSPLARGLPGHVPHPLRPVRIIPARAGFTPDSGNEATAAGDHPRSRGVYVVWSDVGRPRPGSSPLARGLRPGDSEDATQGGIIPARAGFTSSSVRMTVGHADHPRSRGVYPGYALVLRGHGGSSPLARGLPLGASFCAVYEGIIPARAGFTRPSPPARPRTGDHPRSRGVY